MKSLLPEITRRMLLAMNECISKGKVKTTNEFANLIGSNKESISRWKKQTGNVTVDNMLQAHYKLGISFHWLGTGEGEMFLDIIQKIKQIEFRLSKIEKKGK